MHLPTKPRKKTTTARRASSATSSWLSHLHDPRFSCLSFPKIRDESALTSVLEGSGSSDLNSKPCTKWNHGSSQSLCIFSVFFCLRFCFLPRLQPRRICRSQGDHSLSEEAASTRRSNSSPGAWHSPHSVLEFQELKVGHEKSKPQDVVANQSPLSSSRALTCSSW